MIFLLLGLEAHGITFLTSQDECLPLHGSQFQLIQLAIANSSSILYPLLPALAGKTTDVVFREYREKTIFLRVRDDTLENFQHIIDNNYVKIPCRNDKEVQNMFRRLKKQLPAKDVLPQAGALANAPHTKHSQPYPPQDGGRLQAPQLTQEAQMGAASPASYIDGQLQAQLQVQLQHQRPSLPPKPTVHIRSSTQASPPVPHQFDFEETDGKWRHPEEHEEPATSVDSSSLVGENKTVDSSSIHSENECIGM